MAVLMGENQTKRNIILLLKKSGGMSIDELSKAIRITPMGIRQHILSLEQKGFVTYETKRHGIGRPGYIYRLTENAEVLFPKSYDVFALELLQDIEKHDGKEKIDKIFVWRRNRILKRRKEELSGQHNLADIIHGLENILKSEGNFVELWRQNGSYFLMQYNCPINKIAIAYKNACKQELQVYRELTNRDVSLKKSLSQGNHACLFEIPI